MTCRHCQQLLSPHLDDMLSAEERHKVLSHLVQCPVCTERLQQLERNRQLLRTLPSAEVTEAMEQRLQSRVQRLVSRVRSPESEVQSQQSAIRNLQSALGAWWREWRVVSFGTLATCAASLLFYFVTMQAPPQVSAEEVVSSMNQLLNTLDPDDSTRVLTEETPEEAVPNWQEELDQRLWDDEND